MPIERDLGVNLFAGAIFTVFTIVFLTWAFRIREIDEWKLVENQIRKKIADRLQLIARTIYTSFLYSQGDSDLAKKEKEFYKRGDLWLEVAEFRIGIFSKTSGRIQNLYVEHFANKESVELLPDAAFLEAVRKQETDFLLDLVRLFKESAEFFDSICRDFRAFLSSKLVHGIMGIEHGLSLIVHEVEEILLHIRKENAKEPWDIEIKMLQTNIHHVLKEIDKLNKMNLGFYPRPQDIEH